MERVDNFIPGAEAMRSASGVELLSHQVLNFETSIIKHDSYNLAIDAISKIHARYRAPTEGKKFKARCLLIVGESGAGKSTILESYTDRFPAISLEDLEAGAPEALALPDEVKIALQDACIKRVMLIEVPKRATQRSLVAALLGAYGYRAREHWNTDDIVRRIVFLVKETRTELILFDEGHQLVNQSNPETITDALEFIKSLLNRLGVSIVIAGMPKLLSATREIKDMQLRRRMVAPVVLAPYRWTTRQGRVCFQALMVSFEKNLGLPSPSGLGQHDAAMRMYVATGGEVGIASKYLSEALQLALKRGVSSITTELLAEVHVGLEVDSGRLDEQIEFDDVIEEGDISVIRPDATDNPFLCPKQRLRELWMRRYAINATSLGITSTWTANGRDTTLRGCGRGHHTPLGRIT